MERRPRIFLLLDPAKAYDADLLRGIAEFSSGAGRWDLLRPPPFWERPSGKALVESIGRARPDGLILIEPEDLEPFFRLGIPMVVSPYRQRSIPGAINIVTDHAAVGRMAARHLIDSGFREFAFCGYRGMFWSDERGTGFEEELAGAGYRCSRLDPPPIARCGQRRVERDLRGWLEGLPVPCGIMAALDDRAWQVAGVCSAAGIAVPDRAGIVGVDNDELLCTTAPVALSSVATSARRAGFEAARALDEWLAGSGSPGAGSEIVVSPLHVEGRLSTDLLNIDDKVLAKAQRFMRDNRHGPLDVGRVARATGVSRRLLEKRFRDRLDRPVSAEIRRLRAEAFARMLRETNLCVGEIAGRLGFSGPEHVARFFKAETGISPTAYRRAHAGGGRKGID